MNRAHSCKKQNQNIIFTYKKPRNHKCTNMMLFLTTETINMNTNSPQKKKRKKKETINTTKADIL